MERLSYANVVASLALFMMLGGVGYAATQLPDNSVGTSQLKATRQTSGKVKNGTLMQISSPVSLERQGCCGAAGPAGPAGVQARQAQPAPGPLARSATACGRS